MRLLELLPHLHVPRHLEPHGEEADASCHDVANVAEENPAIGHEEEVPELPEAVEIVCEPTLWHLRAPVIVTTRTIVDATHSADASGAVLLAGVADTLDDLLVGRDGSHALADVPHSVADGLGRLQLTSIEARSSVWSHFSVTEGLLLATSSLRAAREDAVVQS